MYGSRESRGDALAQHTTVASLQIFGIYILQTILTSCALLIRLVYVVRYLTYGAASQLAIGIYSLVEDMLLERHAHISVEDGVLAQLLPLLEIDGTGQDMHGVVVTHGGIDLQHLHIVATQLIHNECEEVAAASYERVVRIYPLAVLLACLEHLAAVVGSRAVAEKVVQQLRQRIYILTKCLLVIKALATHIKIYAIAQNRGRQRLAITCQDRASA